MKKIFGIFLCAAFIFALSINLFAAGEWLTNNDFKDDSGIDFRPSNGVSIYYDSDNSTAHNLQEYTAGTKHQSGDTVYGTSSGDSNIYKKDSSTGVAQPETSIFPTIGASDFEDKGWERL